MVKSGLSAEGGRQENGAAGWMLQAGRHERARVVGECVSRWLRQQPGRWNVGTEAVGLYIGHWGLTEEVCRAAVARLAELKRLPGFGTGARRAAASGARKQSAGRRQERGQGDRDGVLVLKEKSREERKMGGEGLSGEWGTAGGRGRASKTASVVSGGTAPGAAAAGRLPVQCRPAEAPSDEDGQQQGAQPSTLHSNADGVGDLRRRKEKKGGQQRRHDKRARCAG